MRARHRGVRGLVSVGALLVGLAGLSVAADLHAAPDPPARVRVTDPVGTGTVPASGAGGAAHGSGPASRDGEGETEGGGARQDAGPSCRVVAQGSVVTAHCRNPDPSTDRVRLHVECARWWDVDSDSAPVDVDPADFAQVTGRCWKEIRSAWVTHAPVRREPDGPTAPESLDSSKNPVPSQAPASPGAPRPSGAPPSSARAGT